MGHFRGRCREAGSLIQFKDDPAPEGRLFKRFDNPTTNDDGNVAFTATLSGGSEGVFRENDTLVALRGDALSAAVPPVTGLLGRVSDSRGPEAQVTDDGDVIFYATILDGAEVDGVDIDEGYFAARAVTATAAVGRRRSSRSSCATTRFPTGRGERSVP